MERPTDGGDWLTAIDRFSTELRRRVATRLEYERLLRELLEHSECPIARLDIRVSEPPEATIALDLRMGSGSGSGSGTPSTDRWTLELAGTKWVVEAWRIGTSPHSHTFDKRQVEELLDSFWKTAVRDEKSRLISLQYGDTGTLLKNYLHNIAAREDSVACFYADLDNFKRVNDTLGHDEGDRVILAWSRMAERELGRECVVLHRSGDEFLLFCPGATASFALELALRLASATSQTDFGTTDIRIGCSVGVAICSPRTATWEDLASRAERAVTPTGGEKQRGRVCLEDSDDNEASEGATRPLDIGFGVRRAICVIRGELARTDVFASPWLNRIAHLAYAEGKAAESTQGVQVAVDEALQWYPGPTTGKGVAAACALEDPYRTSSSEISRIDIALAVARGLFSRALRRGDGRERFSLELRYGPGGSTVELCRGRSSTAVWRTGPSGTDIGGFRSLDLGWCGSLKHLTGADAQGGMRRACLIKIGHKRLSLLPSALFAEVITVDDRPARGGELPDFWEATVARLIALLAATPALSFLYVLGERRFAQQTVSRLEAAATWGTDLELMSYKTGLPSKQVAAASRRIGRIRVFEKERDVVDQLAQDLLSSPAVVEPPRATRARESPRFLERSLEHDAFSLDTYDGIRVNTIAEAFPVVLEMLRKADAEAIILDAAGQGLRELVDFKVVLRTPTVDRIPAFYRTESDSLNGYLRRAFLDDDALFGKELHVDGQFDAVLNHVSDVILGGSKFATRRAILVVPHRVVQGEDLAPLGLVSIRLIPRFAGEEISILYSFTWRTVEAFVGFPYSLFGSVGFAEYLTEKLQARVGSRQGRQMRIGQVSYIAHSLHMFVDDYGQNIARRIVDDASK